jgi:AraC family transcriptional regulator
MSDFAQMTLPSATGIATYPAGATFGPRTMRDFEFVWMIEGDAEYRWGDQVVAAPRGSLVLCRPGARDFFQWDKDRRTKHAYFHFQIRRSPKAWGPREAWPLVRTGADGDVLRPLFRHLLTWHGKGDEQLERLTMQHMLMAFVTGQYTCDDVPQDILPPAVERALAHVHALFDDDPAASIDLSDLAAAAAVTPEHLCRLFKTATGRSPIETVRLARLDRAAVLLARSNYAIKQIADLCGFASQFHFSRLFTQAFGRSPRKLRQELQTGQTPPTSLLLRSNRSTLVR